MAESDFIIAVDPGGNKRLVPAHYLDNPAFGFRLPPSEVVRVEEPAALPTFKVTEPAAAGEKKEARK